MSVVSAIHSVFNNPQLRKVLVLLRVPLSLAVGVGVAWLAGKHRAWFWPGFAVSLFGACWQWWCFSCIMTSKVLALRGPYMVMRNPMYLSRFFLFLGFLIMTANFWLIGGYVLLYYFYMVNRVRREEKKLQGIFGADYEAYCRDVPRFVPGFKRFHARDLFFFNLTCFNRNHGFINMAAVLIVYALLYFSVFVWKFGQA